jgi:hypothetical protein
MVAGFIGCKVSLGVRAGGQHGVRGGGGGLELGMSPAQQRYGERMTGGTRLSVLASGGRHKWAEPGHFAS